MENNSELPETFQYYKQLQRRYSNVKVVTWDGSFNYSAINNYGVKHATGDYYLMLNNDIEVISPTWMSEMLGYCQRRDVGIVGAKLYYADNTVQHAGVVVGVGGFAGHILTRYRRGENGYFGRLVTIQDTSAVTAACLMIKRSTFEQIGGFDEEFVVALNDIDLCLKVRDQGELVVFNPYAELYHYESKSRGFEDTPEKKARFKKEIKRFRTKWSDVLEKGDPYYNPNLTLVRGDCSIRGEYERFEIVEEIEKGNK
ncbi:MAG: glycosyltransferase [Blautia sp.]